MTRAKRESKATDNAEPSEGFPVEVELSPLDVAVSLLRDTHRFISDDTLAQKVWAFIKGNGG